LFITLFTIPDLYLRSPFLLVFLSSNTSEYKSLFFFNPTNNCVFNCSLSTALTSFNLSNTWFAKHPFKETSFALFSRNAVSSLESCIPLSISFNWRYASRVYIFLTLPKESIALTYSIPSVLMFSTASYKSRLPSKCFILVVIVPNGSLNSLVSIQCSLGDVSTSNISEKSLSPQDNSSTSVLTKPL